MAENTCIFNGVLVFRGESPIAPRINIPFEEIALQEPIQQIWDKEELFFGNISHTVCIFTVDVGFASQRPRSKLGWIIPMSSFFGSVTLATVYLPPHQFSHPQHLSSTTQIQSHRCIWEAATPATVLPTQKNTDGCSSNPTRHMWLLFQPKIDAPIRRQETYRRIRGPSARLDFPDSIGEDAGLCDLSAAFLHPGFICLRLGFFSVNRLLISLICS
ncbi:hypothetical protein R6Q59_002777 [Mikania micrantha]